MKDAAIAHRPQGWPSSSTISSTKSSEERRRKLPAGAGGVGPDPAVNGGTTGGRVWGRRGFDALSGGGGSEGEGLRYSEGLKFVPAGFGPRTLMKARSYARAASSSDKGRGY